MDREAIYATLEEAYFGETPHEQAVIEHLPSLLQNDSLIADVGASLGQYTKAACRAVRGSEIHAFEADPVRAARLEENCAEWSAGTTNRLVAHHLALTDTVGEVEFFVTNSDISGALLAHETARPANWEAIAVPGATLDSLFPRRPPDFLKIDVEGAELSVLQGATRVLSEGSPTVLIELHSWAGDGAEELLHSVGYRRCWFYGETLFTKSRALRLRLVALELRHKPRHVLGRWRRRISSR